MAIDVFFEKNVNLLSIILIFVVNRFFAKLNNAKKRQRKERW